MFARWPVLTLLILLVLSSLCLEYHSIALYAVFGMGMISFFVYHCRLKQLLVCVIFLFLVLASHFFFLWQQKPLSSNIFPKNAKYVAEIVSSELVSTDKSRVVVDLMERSSPLAEKVSGRVMLTVGESCLLNKQSLIEFYSKVKEPISYANPGVFDYKTYLRRKNIWGKAFVQRCEDVHVLTNGHVGILQNIHDHLLQSFQHKGLNNGDMMSSLLLGTKSISTEEKILIRDSGLAHLFAISGTHFGVMAALVFFLVTLITSFFPKLYLKIPRQKIAASMTLIFVLLYMILIAPQASVLRAGTMISLFLLAILLERQKQILYIIFLSASLILIFKPMELFSVSFQLSYLCVMILAIVYPPLFHIFEKKGMFTGKYRFIGYIIQVAIITWLLNFGLLPLILMEFGISPVSGLIHNLWAVPYFQFVVIPLSFFYLMTFIFFPGLSLFVLTVWDRSLDVFLSIVNTIQSWHLPVIEFYAPHLIHILLFYFCLFLICLTRRRLILLFSILLLSLSVAYTFYENYLNYDFRITQLDVGQGDSILVQSKEKNMLIDTGGHPYFDMGESVLLPYFRYLWLDHIDIVVLTHSDFDHYGGLFSLLGKISIGEIWINDLESQDESYLQLIDKIKQNHIPIKKITNESRSQLDGKTVVHVLAPSPEFSALTDDNSHSIVLQIQHNDRKALFAGDLTKEGESILLQKFGKELKSDILKVSHHGSLTSTSEAFLKAVQPQWAMIGVGQNSRFGHPHQKILERLSKKGVKVLRTDLDGSIRFLIQDNHILAWKYLD